jgi:hypothetical protein
MISNKDNKAVVLAAGALSQLMEMLRNGSDLGKATAAAALGKLMDCNNDNQAAVLVAGAQLVEMLRDGDGLFTGEGRALYIRTSHDTEQRYIAGLGYTQAWNQPSWNTKMNR